MDSLKRLKQKHKTIKKIVNENSKNPFTKIWDKMTKEERFSYLGLLNGKITLPEEVMMEYEGNLYSILKQFESKMIEKYDNDGLSIIR